MKEYRIIFGATREASTHFRTTEEAFAHSYYRDQTQWYEYTALEVREVSEWEEV